MLWRQRCDSALESVLVFPLSGWSKTCSLKVNPSTESLSANSTVQHFLFNTERRRFDSIKMERKIYLHCTVHEGLVKLRGLNGIWAVNLLSPLEVKLPQSYSLSMESSMLNHKLSAPLGSIWSMGMYSYYNIYGGSTSRSRENALVFSLN